MSQIGSERKSIGKGLSISRQGRLFGSTKEGFGKRRSHFSSSTCCRSHFPAAAKTKLVMNNIQAATNENLLAGRIKAIYCFRTSFAAKLANNVLLYLEGRASLSYANGVKLTSTPSFLAIFICPLAKRYVSNTIHWDTKPPSLFPDPRKLKKGGGITYRLSRRQHAPECRYTVPVPFHQSVAAANPAYPYLS